MANVLIIDDDKSICNMMSKLLARMGHDSVCAHSIAEGKKDALDKHYNVVLLDVHLPDGSGLEILPQIRKHADAPEVIIMTGYGDPDGAEIAISNGAWDYIQKEDSPKKIMLSLQRVIQYCSDVKKPKTPYVALRLDGIVGESPALKSCYDLLAQAAGNDINTLITGETGTGKELFARAIHANSARRGNGFVVIDCAALPGTLVESILFGNVKGAYTGADQSRQGLVEQANNGTLFLDEIGELPVPVQKSFLRVLQEHCFRPVGGSREIACDFRILAATNRNLDEMVQTGQFRADLLFRLKTLEIRLPALRSRPEDIRPLVIYHLNRIFERSRGGAKGIAPNFYETLMNYKWPGNVRELVNALETAVAASGAEGTLFSKHLPAKIRVHAARRAVLPAKSPAPVQGRAEPWPPDLPPLKEYRKIAADEAEKKYLLHVMETTRGDIQEACRIANVGRSRLYGLLKRHGLTFTG